MKYNKDITRGMVAEEFYNSCGAHFLSHGTVHHPKDLRGLQRWG